MPNKMLPPWEPGDEISAARLNEMQRHADRSAIPDSISTSSGTASRDAQPCQIRFMRLTECIGEGLEETADNQSSENVTRDRKGRPIAYNVRSRDFDSLSVEPYDNLVDAMDGIYDRESIVPCVSQNGKWVPLYCYPIGHAVTCKDDDGTYPKESEEPNVYPIRYCRLSYAEVGGRQSVTREYLKEGEGTEGPDGFIHNIYEGTEPHYIPEETLIWFYRVPGPNGPQNFTNICCEYDDKSSSSISTSESSLSSSSKSSSSSSASSNSSSSSQSESKSSSSSNSSSDSASSSSSKSTSQSSSSKSTSDSSKSTSSQSPQSASSLSTSDANSSSTDDRTVTPITAITFDPDTCEITYKTRSITFPVGSGVVIGDEVDN